MSRGFPSMTALTGIPSVTSIPRLWRPKTVSVCHCHDNDDSRSAAYRALLCCRCQFSVFGHNVWWD
jgi:hypothetical protein